MSETGKRDGAPPVSPRAWSIRSFQLFWLAESTSEFGNYITSIALQVLVVLTLGGTAIELGFLNAARWLPYLVLGLLVGALIERRARKPVMVITDLARALLLALIPLLWAFGALSYGAVIAIVLAFGTASLLNDSASQSFLPRIVPRRTLLDAHARLDQSAMVAQTSGPLLGGALVSAISAPFAVLVDAVSYLVSALAVARIRVAEPPPLARSARSGLWSEIRAGLRWTYRHRELGALALSTHGWFVFNSMLVTVFVPFVLISLGFGPFELGVALAAAGIGGFLGSLLSLRAGMRWGAGRVVVLSRASMPLSWAVIALAPETGQAWIVIAALTVGQGLYGFAMGLENANEMGYRQSVTPDELQGRMNTTMRSMNRAMIVLGAPIGGLLAEFLGYRPTLWIGIVGLTLVAIAIGLSPFRNARHGD